jgi:hypothetical protein
VNAKICLILIAAVLLLTPIASGQYRYRATYGQYYQPAQYYYPPQTPVYQTPVYQPQPTVNRLDRKVDGHDQYNVGRSAEPPTSEADKLFMVLITSDAYMQDERQRNLVSWFNYNPRLAKLRSTTRFNWYAQSSPHYRDRLRFKLGEALPIVAITKPDGEVLLNVTAISMPGTAGELADLCDDAVNARYAPPPVPGRASLYSGQPVADCPNCDPPAPPSQPDDSQVDPLPEVIPAKKVDATGAYLVIGIFVLAGFAVLVILACFGVSGRASSANRIFP